jgi:rubredoxin
MSKMICSICGYVYDPSLGIENSAIAKGTSFEQLPQHWICPTCGGRQKIFLKLRSNLI